MADESNAKGQNALDPDYTQTEADPDPDFASITGRDLDFNEPQTGKPAEDREPADGDAIRPTPAGPGLAGQ